jgi:DnaJ-class molecular chaperone
MDFKDYYATLGVTKSATAKEIKQAFRKLARKFHPDVNPGDKTAESKFKELNEAYEVLGDPDTRKKYDELGANWRLYEQAGAGGPHPGGTRSDRAGGPGPGGFRTMTPEEMETVFGDTNPFSDFFNTFFGGGFGTAEEGRRPAGSTRARARKGRDVEHDIELTLEDAYHGARRRLSVQHDGQLRTVDVRIPAGVTDGSRVRIAGEGEQGSNGGSGGDLFLRVRLAHHPRFERTGRDLYVKVPLPVPLAVMGGEADVQTMTGQSVRLRIPPLTQNGQVFRLKGYGMPTTGTSGERGDLYARVEAQLPAQLSTEEREHYEALARLQPAPTTNSAA